MRSKRMLLVLSGALLAGAACVSPGEPGVAIESIEADLVFGIEEPTPPAAPANTDVGAIPEDALDGGFDMGAFRNPVADRLPPIGAVGEPSNDCPTAPPTAAAALPAEATITGPIREGVYRWKRTGTQSTPIEGSPQPLVVQISGFEQRIVRNVQPYEDPFDPDAYTFEMVQTLVDRPVLQVRTFLVKPTSSGQLAPDGGSNTPVDEPNFMEPEAGISLIKIEEFSEDDERLGTFEPMTGLLLLPLPVSPNLAYQTSATDARSGQVILGDVRVGNRARIDACGDLVDGWRVESSQTRSDAAGGTVTYNAVYATQYGGMPILEEVATETPEGVATSVAFSLAQLDPDPLPEP